jgi:hypothetical protein
MNNALKILTTRTQNALFIEQSIYSYFRIKMIHRRSVKWKKLRNEYFFNQYFLVVQTLRFVLSTFLQQMSVEQKAKKQGDGEKQKKRKKTRERQIEIRRRQIKK